MDAEDFIETLTDEQLLDFIGALQGAETLDDWLELVYQTASDRGV